MTRCGNPGHSEKVLMQQALAVQRRRAQPACARRVKLASAESPAQAVLRGGDKPHNNNSGGQPWHEASQPMTKQIVFLCLEEDG
jgi:hypothetical protein